MPAKVRSGEAYQLALTLSANFLENLLHCLLTWTPSIRATTQGNSARTIHLVFWAVRIMKLEWSMPSLCPPTKASTWWTVGEASFRASAQPGFVRQTVGICFKLMAGFRLARNSCWILMALCACAVALNSMWAFAACWSISGRWAVA